MRGGGVAEGGWRGRRVVGVGGCECDEWDGGGVESATSGTRGAWRVRRVGRGVRGECDEWDGGRVASATSGTRGAWRARRVRRGARGEWVGLAVVSYRRKRRAVTVLGQLCH